MITTTDIKITVYETKEEYNFKNETLSISNTSQLWISNAGTQESEFFETLKIWYEIEKKSNKRLSYSINTSQPLKIDSFKKILIKKVSDDNQAIVFEWY
ncbi:hypothetical protein ACTHP3_00885 [Shouchella rhizosphaerae]|uniref:hypothetical protein n=1 Tax=Shouchella rhizosphaerae TaxID=866786 RepID=UPI003F806E65